MEVLGEVLVVPFFGQGHLFPCMELCKHLSSHNCKAILIIPSHLSSSIPSSICRPSSLIEVVEIPNSAASPPPPEMAAPPPSSPELSSGSPPGRGFGPGPNPFQQMGIGLEAFLSDRYKDPTQTRPVYAVLDVMMSWSKEFFAKFGVPTVSFFTSGACSSAMQYASWKERAEEMIPGETRKIAGLPGEMELSHSDLEREQGWWRHQHVNNLSGQPMDGPDGVNGPLGGTKFSPPGQGDRRRWLDEIDGSTALLFNTCDGLEHPFLKYIAAEIDKPVYGVGPLLPENIGNQPVQFYMMAKFDGTGNQITRKIK